MSVLLGRVGLLDGRRATTHWRSPGWMRESFPTVTVEEKYPPRRRLAHRLAVELPLFTRLTYLFKGYSGSRRSALVRRGTFLIRSACPRAGGARRRERGPELRRRWPSRKPRFRQRREEPGTFDVLRLVAASHDSLCQQGSRDGVPRTERQRSSGGVYAGSRDGPDYGGGSRHPARAGGRGGYLRVR